MNPLSQPSLRIPAPSLDEYVALFEQALAGPARPDLHAFLPPSADPLYPTVLAELIRVELEHDWEKGQPRSLAEYRAAFPGALADPVLLAAIAFEEYRLRRSAGQNPDPGDYARQFRIDTSDWPTPQNRLAGNQAEGVPPIRSAGEENDNSLLTVARSYLAFRKGKGREPLGAWMQACGQYAGLARVLGDLHASNPEAALRLASGVTSLPQEGDTFQGFRLLSELGRGAFGRVFLAQQLSLAQRLVALKITPNLDGEPQTLAQLQHTHIVPIYSLHQSGTLQVVCMPYFGSVTLADVLADLSRRPSLPQQGSDLLSRLSQRASSSKGNAHLQTVCLKARAVAATAIQPVPASAPAHDRSASAQEQSVGGSLHSFAGPALKRLEGLSYVDAVVWLGCCLADGLAHAHERGILHRDLKPANILLTDEGQPMLLDFNLAEDIKLRGTLSAALVGGTVPYMAPEQLSAFRGEPATIDQRSDIFALGMILYELLTGQPPFPPCPRHDDLEVFIAGMLQSRRTLPIPIRSRNPAVSPAVWSILRRCLDPDPSQRYESARQLHEDLQRQLDSQPLRHAPEPSLVERVRKQFRRSPRLVVRLVMGTALLVVALAAGVAHVADRNRQTQQARAELEFSRAEQERNEKETQRARADLLRRTEEARAELTLATKEVRYAMFLLSIEDGSLRRAEGLAVAHPVLQRYEVLDREDWQQRDRVALLPAPEAERLVGDLGELLLLMARGTPPAEALPLLERAESCFGPVVPPAVWFQKADVLRQLGRNREAETLRQKALTSAPRRSRDHLLLARTHLLARRYREALLILRRAVEVDSSNLMAWFLRGVCESVLEEYASAIASYNVCLALATDFDGAYFNRGLAHYRRGQHALALADFNRALELRPGVADAHLNRGLALQGLGQFREAEADFGRAIQLQPQRAHLLFVRAQVRLLLRDPKGADADWQEGLRVPPRDERCWNARGQFLLRRKDLEGALRCFDEGLKVNPTSRALLNARAHVLGHYLKRDKDALAVMDRVVQLYPDYVFGYSDRGILRARLGQQEAALDDARQALARDGSAEMSYRVACIHALLARRNDDASANHALQLLRDALRRGFGAEELPDDEDLRSLHTHPEFVKLRELARTLRPARGV